MAIAVLHIPWLCLSEYSIALDIIYRAMQVSM